MGCCESKLLNMQSTSDKYQAGPSYIEQDAYLTKKDMVEINLALPEQHEESSIFTLRTGLQKIVSCFEQERGPINCNFLDKEGQIIDQLCYKTIQKKSQLKNETNISQSNDKQSNDNSQLNTCSVVSSQLTNQVSQFYQNNTKILSYASLSSKRQLEKQLFYINSNQIGNTILLKWTEQERFGKNFQNFLFADLIKQIQSNFVPAFLMAIIYERKTNINLLAFKQLKNAIGMRVFVNGIKRMLKIQQKNKQNLTPFQICYNLTQLLQTLKNTNLCYCGHILTGWIPQIINLSDFQNTNQIFKRLSKNFNTSNLMIAFVNRPQQNLQKSQKILLLKQINQQSQTMLFISINNKQKIYENQISMNWSIIIQKYPLIHILWNPFIYGFNKKIQTISILEQQQTSFYKRSRPKFLVKIPASKTQVQVRILVQIHQSTPICNYFEIFLYESDFKYFDFENNHTFLRNSKSSTPHYLSQIFIFQKSHQKSQYIFMLNFIEQNNLNFNDIQITIDVFTFFPIDAKIIKQPLILNNLSIQTQFALQNAGFGMNSPFFHKNLIYSLNIEQNMLCKIDVQLNTVEPAIFQICVIPDNLNKKDITLIKPSQLSRQIIQSDQFQMKGSLQFLAKNQNYLVVIVCFTPTVGTIQLNVSNYLINNEQINQNKRRLYLQRVLFQPKFLREFIFSWDVNNPGPRKRTKTNSQFIFYPIKTFANFFENPYVDYYLSEGQYQFSIISKTFQSQFTTQKNSQHYQQKCLQIYNATPPSLSMAIFQLNTKKDKAKIILDDYEYVPFGIGFWTQSFKLQGLYRFVFTKMQKRIEKGAFKIRKINDSI